MWYKKTKLHCVHVIYAQVYGHVRAHASVKFGENWGRGGRQEAKKGGEHVCERASFAHTHVNRDEANPKKAASVR